MKKVQKRLKKLSKLIHSTAAYDTYTDTASYEYNVVCFPFLTLFIMSFPILVHSSSSLREGKGDSLKLEIGRESSYLNRNGFKIRSFLSTYVASKTGWNQK